jgi:hypothetical protein
MQTRFTPQFNEEHGGALKLYISTDGLSLKRSSVEEFKSQRNFPLYPAKRKAWKFMKKACKRGFLHSDFLPGSSSSDFRALLHIRME